MSGKKDILVQERNYHKEHEEEMNQELDKMMKEQNQIIYLMIKWHRLWTSILTYAQICCRSLLHIETASTDYNPSRTENHYYVKVLVNHHPLAVQA